MRASMSKSRSWCSSVRSLRMAQTAIRQSTLDRTVTPARRASLYRSTACSYTAVSSGASTIGNASNARRAIRKARSSRKPCSTSCRMGRQSTISSRSANSRNRMRGGRRNVSIQTEVSTRYTVGPGPTRTRPPARLVVTHRGQIAFPKTGSGQLQDASGARPSHEVGQRPVYGLRVCALSTEPLGFLQEVAIKHKICAFHVFNIPAAGER